MQTKLSVHDAIHGAVVWDPATALSSSFLLRGLFQRDVVEAEIAWGDVSDGLTV